MSAAGAALGGLLFGFDTAVISGATNALQSQFALTEASLGFTVASALIGTVLGSLIAGAPADRYGRKAIMLSVAIAYVVSSLGTALAHDWYVLIAFRFLGGVAIGAASVVTPIYIAEVSPARFRGRLVAMNQLNIVLGILIAFLSNYIIAQILPPRRLGAGCSASSGCRPSYSSSSRSSSRKPKVAGGAYAPRTRRRRDDAAWI
ncbi:MFS transporter [Sphingomonas sp. LR59]|uniref:MFS transporter n=1 Tax=Sphingomonas sp. LR59 TaxID=3050232 RepID=UPI002FE0A2DD